MVMPPTVQTLGTLYIHLLDLIMCVFVLNLPLMHIGKPRLIICCLLELAKLVVASLALHRQTGYTHSVLTVVAHWLG